VIRTLRFILIAASLASFGAAQQPSTQQSSTQQPKVKVNMLNVCSPAPQEQKEIASALARIPKQPLFSADFEVDRGRSTLEQSPNFLQPGSGGQASPDAPTADWVRIRHEFAVQAMFSSVQYSFSRDSQNMVETVVFHVRDPKDLMELSIEDSAASVTSPTDMLATTTPATHIKLDRFGKSSVVLARCSASENGPAPDQSAYEPLFSSATSIVENYRGLLHASHVVPEEMAQLSGASVPKSAPASKLRKPVKPQK
jgi:hypothetical protein